MRVIAKAELRIQSHLYTNFIEYFFRMKSALFFTLSFFLSSISCFAQNTEYVYNKNEVHFYGLDFSHAHMIGEDFDRADKIVQHYFKSWNDLLFTEKSKYNIEKHFDFKKAYYHTQYLEKSNEDVDPYELRINGTHKIERAKIFESIRNYDFPEDEGLGMVIFVETFNEYSDQSSLYYVFFDLESRDLILIQPMVGESGGAGFRNSWANSIYFTMKKWKETTYRGVVMDKIALLPEPDRSKYFNKVQDEFHKDDIDYFVHKVEKILNKKDIEFWGPNYYKALAVPSNAVFVRREKQVPETIVIEDQKVVLPEAELVIPPYISPVDINIPTGTGLKANRYAFIIGNEDYQSYQPTLSKESNVDYANHDAEVFKQYAEKVLGVPSENIVYLLDAKIVEINRGLIKINKAIELSNGNAEVFVYYAGHGFPDQNSKDPYLIPVDVSAGDLKYAFKMSDIYASLTEFESKRITVFLDACFSGGARNQGLMTARGVKIVPKDNYLKGNIVIFTASSGLETAQPYHKEKHGLFTYYLLKKLQESKGNVSYKEMEAYLKEKVGIKAVFVNESEQTPQLNSSPAIGESWQKWKFN